MTVKRKHKRKEVAVRAWVVVAAGSPPQECMLADISDGGARIESLKPEAIPANFVLFLSPNGSVKRKCKVAWRRGRELGVQWVAA